jgi:hypothetical protein
VRQPPSAQLAWLDDVAPEADCTDDLKTVDSCTPDVDNSPAEVR